MASGYRGEGQGWERPGDGNSLAGGGSKAGNSGDEVGSDPRWAVARRRGQEECWVKVGGTTAASVGCGRGGGGGVIGRRETRGGGGGSWFREISFVSSVINQIAVTRNVPNSPALGLPRCLCLA